MKKHIAIISYTLLAVFILVTAINEYEQHRLEDVKLSVIAAQMCGARF